MKLNPVAFEMIKTGKQKFESRLYDEKRQLIKIGDEIEFYKLPDLTTSLKVYVKGLSLASNFETLYSFIDPVLGGWEKMDGKEKAVNDMTKYYSMEEQSKYGVVAIHIVVE